MELVDAVIIGAGPAGSTLARQLARGGWRVALVEGEQLGRDRVCGGFLGPETTRLWRELDLERYAAMLPRARVTRLALSGAKGVHIDTPLPDGGGYGISRAIYDRWLCDRAVEAGANLMTRTRVQRIQRSARMLKVALTRDGGSQALCAFVAIRATGRRHVAEREARDRDPAFGCKTIYEGIADVEQCVTLHFVRSGHVGFNRLPDGRATMCLSVGRSRLQAVRGRLDELMERVAEENPFIGRHLRGARRVGPWTSCQAQPDERELFFHDGCFNVGDAVTMLNPILGGGLSVAMGSSALLARQLLAHRPQTLDAFEVARRYAQAWQAHFAGRASLGRWLGWCEHTTMIADGLLRWLSAHPAMVGRLVRRARPTLREDALAMMG